MFTGQGAFIFRREGGENQGWVTEFSSNQKGWVTIFFFLEPNKEGFIYINDSWGNHVFFPS